MSLRECDAGATPHCPTPSFGHTLRMEFSDQVKRCFEVYRQQRQRDSDAQIAATMFQGKKTVRVVFLDSKGEPVTEHAFNDTEEEWLEYRALVHAELNPSEAD